MKEVFRHLHMPADLACDFLGVFSRMEYALKVSRYAQPLGSGVQASWDRFANDIDKRFSAISDDGFKAAVEYLLAHPPRKQVLRKGGLTFVDQTVDTKQARAQQTLLMVRTVRNNLFHGGKYLPEGEREQGRNRQLVSASLVVLQCCVTLSEDVRQHFEH